MTEPEYTLSLLAPGDRIELVEMIDDPDPIPVGAQGTVEKVNHVRIGPSWAQVYVDWDNGRTLTLSVPPDRYRIIDPTIAQKLDLMGQQLDAQENHTREWSW